MSIEDRVAFSPGEFAALFGKSQTWGYRQLYAGKVKAVTEYGRLLIPAAEVERILGKAGEYNGIKPTVKRGRSRKDPWKEFLENRRRVGGNRIRTNGGSVARPVFGGDQRDAALARLGRGSRKRDCES